MSDEGWKTSCESAYWSYFRSFGRNLLISNFQLPSRVIEKDKNVPGENSAFSHTKVRIEYHIT